MLSCAVPPSMSTVMSEAQGVVGDAFSMSCEASGLPAPKYEFHKVTTHHDVYSRYNSRDFVAITSIDFTFSLFSIFCSGVFQGREGVSVMRPWRDVICFNQ